MVTNMQFDVTRLGNTVGAVSVEQQGLNTRFDCDCAAPGAELLRLAAVCGGEVVALGVMMPEGGRLKFGKRFSRNALRELGYSEPSAFILTAPGDAVRTAQSPPEVAAADTSEDAASVQVLAIEPERDAVPPAPPDIPAEPRELHIPAQFELKIELVPRQGGGVPPEPGAISIEPIASGGGTKPPEPPESTWRGPPPPPRGDSTPPEPEAKSSVPGWRAEPDPRTLLRESDGVISGEVRGALISRDGDVVRLAIPISPDEAFPMMPVFCFGEAAELDGRDFVIFKIRDGVLTL
jgi:hypothetical protein